MNCRSDAADQVKRVVSMRAAAERYGLHIVRGGYISCPFHMEKTPSLKLYDQPGKGFYCYGCNTGGSVIDFVMQLFQLDFRAAVVRLATDFGISVETNRITRQEALAARAVRTAQAMQVQRYTTLLERWRKLSSIRWERAPISQDDLFDDEWCSALLQLPALEHEISELEDAGYGR